MAPELSLADHVCLAIIGEGRTHGWAIVKLLSADGELGRIWTLSRPLTYRSIDRLVEAGMIERTETGRRAQLGITRSGRRRRRVWLDAPVQHLRDLRTEFLLKLTLRQRCGLDCDELLARQRQQLDSAITALIDHEPRDAVDRWRRESAIAAQRFLESA